MRNAAPDDTRTLEQILAGEPPQVPAPNPVRNRNPARFMPWIWAAILGIVVTAIVASFPDEAERQRDMEQQARLRRAEQARREQVVADALKAREARVDAAIAKGEVFIGMTRDEVIVSWVGHRAAT